MKVKTTLKYNKYFEGPEVTVTDTNEFKSKKEAYKTAYMVFKKAKKTDPAVMFKSIITEIIKERI